MPSLNIRHIDAATVERLNRAARARGMTQGEYVTALVELHQSLLATNPHLPGNKPVDTGQVSLVTGIHLAHAGLMPVHT